MALTDAKKSIEIDSRWWKGYCRKSQALKALKRYNDALCSLLFAFRMNKAHQKSDNLSEIQVAAADLVTECMEKDPSFTFDGLESQAMLQKLVILKSKSLNNPTMETVYSWLALSNCWKGSTKTTGVFFCSDEPFLQSPLAVAIFSSLSMLGSDASSSIPLKVWASILISIIDCFDIVVQLLISMELGRCPRFELGDKTQVKSQAPAECINRVIDKLLLRLFFSSYPSSSDYSTLYVPLSASIFSIVISLDQLNNRNFRHFWTESHSLNNLICSPLLFFHLYKDKAARDMLLYMLWQCREPFFEKVPLSRAEYAMLQSHVETFISIIRSCGDFDELMSIPPDCEGSAVQPETVRLLRPIISCLLFFFQTVVETLHSQGIECSETCATLFFAVDQALFWRIKCAHDDGFAEAYQCQIARGLKVPALSGSSSCFCFLSFFMIAVSLNDDKSIFINQHAFHLSVQGLRHWSNDYEVVNSLYYALTAKHGSAWVIDAEFVAAYGARMSTCLLETCVNSFKNHVTDGGRNLPKDFSKCSRYHQIFFALFSLRATGAVQEDLRDSSSQPRVILTESAAKEIVQSYSVVLEHGWGLDYPGAEKYVATTLCYIITQDIAKADFLQHMIDFNFIPLMLSLMKRQAPCPQSLLVPCSYVLKVLMDHKESNLRISIK